MDNPKIQLEAQSGLVFNHNKTLLFLKPFSCGTELFVFFQIISKWIDSTLQSLMSLRCFISKSFRTSACSVSSYGCVEFCLFSFILCCLLFFLIFPCLSAAVLYLFRGVIEYLRFLAFDRFVFDLISALNMCSVGRF